MTAQRRAEMGGVSSGGIRTARDSTANIVLSKVHNEHNTYTSLAALKSAEKYKKQSIQ